MSTSGPPSTPPPNPTGPPTVSPMAKHTQLVRSGANWLIWIAGLSLVNSVLFVTGSHWSFFLGLAATQVSDAFGRVIITGSTGVAGGIWGIRYIFQIFRQGVDIFGKR